MKKRERQGYFLKSKKGEMLTENVVFIILNLAFFSIIILFLFLKMGDAAPIEERYAKQIALLIDAARPGMLITLDISEAVEKAEDKSWPLEGIISIKDNCVTVKLRDDGFYTYSFFNDVDAQFEMKENNKLDIRIR